MTCSRFGRHSASSHRPEQQQPSRQPEVSGRNGPGGEPQRGDGPGPDPGALHPLHEGVSQRRPAPTRVQEDLRRSQQLRRGVALHRDHLPLLRHQPGKRQGSSLWALASGLWALGSGLWAPGSVFSVHFVLCLKDNTLDFLEYVAALHLILRGNLEDRLKWSFKMYDKDGNGKLDRHEVKRLIKVRPSIRPSEQNSHLEPGLS